MIFVTVGTNEAPFDRLLRTVDVVPRAEPTVVQFGSCTVRPAGAACVPYLSFEQMIDCMRRARVVVTHAGTGSVLVALEQGKRPIVVPRLRRHGEAVDDHQLRLAVELAGEGLARLVETPEQLATALAEPVASELRRPEGGGRLAGELGSYLSSVLGSDSERAPASTASS